MVVRIRRHDREVTRHKRHGADTALVGGHCRQPAVLAFAELLFVGRTRHPHDRRHVYWRRFLRCRPYLGSTHFTGRYVPRHVAGYDRHAEPALLIQDR